jgi:elongation factor P
MSVGATELRRGMAILFKDDIHIVVDTDHVKPGKGPAYCQAKLKNFKTGAIVNNRYRSQEQIETVFLEGKEMEYSYSDGDNHYFMDGESFELVPLPGDLLGEDGALYLMPQIKVQVQLYEGNPVSLTLPHTVTMKVTDTPPSIKGATATNQNKQATLETGLSVMVPPFVEPNELIRVDTRTGEYMERVKE